MKKKIIASLIVFFMGMLTPDMLKEFVDKVLDYIEDHVLGSKSDLDDKIVIPICDMIRKTFDMPDEDL